jgi:hypothetical protein
LIKVVKALGVVVVAIAIAMAVVDPVEGGIDLRRWQNHDGRRRRRVRRQGGSADRADRTVVSTHRGTVGAPIVIVHRTSHGIRHGCFGAGRRWLVMSSLEEFGLKSSNPTPASNSFMADPQLVLSK